MEDHTGSPSTMANGLLMNLGESVGNQINESKSEISCREIALALFWTDCSFPVTPLAN